MAPEPGRLVVLEHGAIEVLDPMVQQRWTLAPSSRWAENISADTVKIVLVELRHK